jgi:hypothetical protein
MTITATANCNHRATAGAAQAAQSKQAYGKVANVGNVGNGTILDADGSGAIVIAGAANHISWRVTA